MTMNCLDPVGRRATSEGSLSLTMAGRRDANQRRRGSKGRGDHESTGKGDVRRGFRHSTSGEGGN